METGGSNVPTSHPLVLPQPVPGRQSGSRVLEMLQLVWICRTGQSWATSSMEGPKPRDRQASGGERKGYGLPLTMKKMVSPQVQD